MFSRFKRALVLVFILFTTGGFSQALFQFGEKSSEQNENRPVNQRFNPFFKVELAALAADHIDISYKSFDYQILGGICFGYAKYERSTNRTVTLNEIYTRFAYNPASINGIKPDEEKIRTNLRSFGIGVRRGFGYQMGAVALAPYHQIELTGNMLEFEQPLPIFHQNQASALERYPGAVRLGLTYGGGASLNLLQSTSIHGGYEAAIVYPRWLFMQWLSSFLIQQIGLSVTANFGAELMNTMPFFGPFVYWVLNNGLSLLYVSQMRENMNWPFDSEAPLTFLTAKIGVQIIF